MSAPSEAQVREAIATLAALLVSLADKREPAPREPASPPRVELLTVTEASKRLRLSRAYMYRLIRNGEIRSFRRNGRIRIREWDLEEWIKKHCPQVP